MKLIFLGTGAADWPLERPENSEEFRRLSSALIDDILLIDPGPQVMDALKEYGKDPRKIQYILNTHPHSDHLCPETVAHLEFLGAEFIPLSAGDVRTIGRYILRAYAANHGTCKGAVHFLISDREHSLFYGLDGAWLLYDEVQAIQQYRPDLAVLDATIGDIDGDYRIFEHNNLRMVLEMQQTLAPYVGRFCISHMARTLHTDHQTLSKRMDNHNVLVARDGLEINL